MKGEKKCVCVYVNNKLKRNDELTILPMQSIFQSFSNHQLHVQHVKRSIQTIRPEIITFHVLGPRQTPPLCVNFKIRITPKINVPYETLTTILSLPKDEKANIIGYTTNISYC